jgi:hypothetical protein
MPLLAIELVSAVGTTTPDPNGAVALAALQSQWLVELPPLSERTSDISERPALLYRADDLEVALGPIRR